MKRLVALLPCFCLALSLMGCAASPQQTPIPPASSSAGEQEEESASAQDPADESAPADTSGEAPAQADDGVQVTLQSESGGITDPTNNTLLVKYSFVTPTVAIPGNEKAQAAIQADLDQIIEHFQEYIQGDLLEQSQQEYTGGNREFSEENYNYADLTIQVARADEKVISLVIDQIGYSGGAHGWDNRYCANYDAETGEKLTFDMLGEDFRAAAEEKVLAMGEEMQAQKQVLFENYADSLPLVVCDGTETYPEVYQKVYPDLYGPDSSMEAPEGTLSPMFYLDDEGVTFISGEYVMQSYAGGIIEFPIAYEAFEGVIRQEYVK